MGFEGCLEDLGLGDILQVVSLSKKSGTLELRCGRDGGCVYFRQGHVIRAVSDRFPQGLGQLLVARGLLTERQLAEILTCQQQSAEHEPFGVVAGRLFQIDTALIEKVIEAQIEKIILDFFSWAGGTFHFYVEDSGLCHRTMLNPLDLMLEKGLCAQMLALKCDQLCRRGDLDNTALQNELERINSKPLLQGLDLLRSMLAELEHPELGGGVLLLILRYASELMDRAVVFDVRHKTLVGLGQFGLHNPGGGSADELVRSMRLPIAAGSLFADVLKRRSAMKQEVSDSESEQRLIALFQGACGGLYVAPLVSEGQVIALLCGEILEHENADHKIRAFEVFLSQAGLALEQVMQGK